MSSSWKDEHSQDDDAVLRHRADDLAERGADVPGHHHGHARDAMHVAEQLDRRGLAVRARDGDDLAPQPAPRELELADDGDAAPARLGDDGRLARDAGRLHDEAGAVQQLDAAGAQVRLDPCRQVDVRAPAVDGDDRLPLRRQEPRGGDPRPREADDERGHAIDCW